jgi:outer membrane protein assembly factor BamB
MHKRNLATVLSLAALTAVFAAYAADSDVVQFGHTPSRNMVQEVDKPIPSKWDASKGVNIKWSAPLGSQSYAGPVVAGGKVFVGTNNEHGYNEKITGDRGNVMAFDATTGEFLWQSAWPKLPSGRVNDWPLQGVCSTPAIVGDRVYYVSNRGEVVCADTEGFRDGENDGPRVDEEHTLPIDEDVVWTFDFINELDVFPHNLAAGSPLIVDGILFTITGQGVDEGHINIPSPLGPSFIALDVESGELLWESALPGDNVLHGSWSNPSYGVWDGKPQVLFPGGDGWLYAFEPKTGKLIWKFDLNPKGSVWELGGRGTRNNVISMATVYDGLVYIGVGQDPEHGEGPGNFWVIDPSGKTGDITDSSVVWHRGGDDFHRTMSTAAIHDGLVYIADLSGFLYCLDAKTGAHHWTYDAFAAIWGSAFVADGKVYLGDEDGDIAVLKVGKGKDGEPELIGEYNMGAAVYTTPVAHDGVLYVVSRNRIWAIEEGASPAPTPPKKPAEPAEPAGEKSAGKGKAEEGN